MGLEQRREGRLGNLTSSEGKQKGFLPCSPPCRPLRHLTEQQILLLQPRRYEASDQLRGASSRVGRLCEVLGEWSQGTNWLDAGTGLEPVLDRARRHGANLGRSTHAGPESR